MFELNGKKKMVQRAMKTLPSSGAGLILRGSSISTGLFESMVV